MPFWAMPPSPMQPQTGRPTSIICGDVRVQILGASVIRLERKGAKGFEDRLTFNVTRRPQSVNEPNIVTTSDTTTIRTPRFIIRLPNRATSLSQVKVFAPNGQAISTGSDKAIPPSWLPSPGKMPKVWTMSDAPRMTAPAWGATPGPAGDPSSGWDRNNDAPDEYLFVSKDYAELRQDFLAITGRIEKPPLFAFGFIDSRYYPYTEKEALGAIDTYRAKGIPLDMFVVDTDWRINGSHGYDSEPKYFPDMKRFLDEAHARKVRIMFNDHPEPAAEDALDPVEMTYRQKGLTEYLNMGMDVWWYDRNWGVSFKDPMPGIPHEVWGERVYHDITQLDRPSRRPLIMSQFYGINNGVRDQAPPAAMHRYPIWWTGDTSSTWTYLQYGVQNGVDMGVLALTPYVGEDLGGHVGTPSPELYVRYLQYGCLSPTTRVHCTRGYTRYPWEFGAQAEKIVTDFIKLRYRLLPTIYSAAQRAYEDGTPVLRRLDLEWPKYKEAARNDEYLLGDDLLVAPIMSGEGDDAKAVPTTNLKAQFFNGINLAGAPLLSRTDSKIDFNWGEGAPGAGVPVDDFSARWTGNLPPLPETGDYTFVTHSDDGVRLFIDDKPVIDAWHDQSGEGHLAKVHLEKGTKHTLRLEYYEKGGDALVRLGWQLPSEHKTRQTRTAWIPPGQWTDLNTGATVQGPRTIEAGATLEEIPMWARAGGLVTLAPEMSYTGEKPWDKLTLEAWLPAKDGVFGRTLTEDDGMTNAYLEDREARTQLQMVRKGGNVQVHIAAPQGPYAASLPTRSWTVRLNLPAGVASGAATLDGRSISYTQQHGRRSLASAGKPNFQTADTTTLVFDLTPDQVRTGATLSITIYR